MKLFFHFLTSTMKPLKFRNGSVIASHTFYGHLVNYLSMPGLESNHVSKRGPWCQIGLQRWQTKSQSKCLLLLYAIRRSLDSPDSLNRSCLWQLIVGTQLRSIETMGLINHHYGSLHHYFQTTNIMLWPYDLVKQNDTMNLILHLT